MSEPTRLPRKFVVGLVGRIGAGKSAVAAAMARRGAAVIDADRIGHEVLELPEVKAALIELWGPGVIQPDGTANRRAIAAIVFPKVKELRKLEAVVFPHIGQRVEQRIAEANADPSAAFVALDAAVMLEAGWDRTCDKVVYVDAPRKLRLSRLAARSGWTRDEVFAREAAQMPKAEKIPRANAYIVNSGSMELLQEVVDKFLQAWGLPASDAEPTGRPVTTGGR